MRFEYKVGDKVISRENQNRKGIVVEAESSWEILVKWDNDEEEQFEEARFIMPADPNALKELQKHSKVVQAQLDKATSMLEAAWEAWRKASQLYSGDDEANPYDGIAHEMRDDPSLDLSKFEEVFENTG